MPCEAAADQVGGGLLLGQSQRGHGGQGCTLARHHAQQGQWAARIRRLPGPAPAAARGPLSAASACPNCLNSRTPGHSRTQGWSRLPPPAAPRALLQESQHADRQGLGSLKKAPLWGTEAATPPRQQKLAHARHDLRRSLLCFHDPKADVHWVHLRLRHQRIRFRSVPRDSRGSSSRVPQEWCL